MANNIYGRFHWNELWTSDISGAKTFYADTMGWRYDDMNTPDGPYVVAIKNNEPVAGMAPLPTDLPGNPAPLWMSFIEVEAVDTVVSKAKSGGATIVRAPHDVRDVGRVAIIQDPAGAVFGLVTPEFND